jgi:hypothetical protein
MHALGNLSSKSLPSFAIPFRRNPNFVGRSLILEQIAEKLAMEGARVALVGLGGTG